MKIKNVFITLGVCAAMGFGAFAGIKAAKGEVKEAKAATTRLYLDLTQFKTWYDTDTSVVFKVKTYNDTYKDKLFSTTKVGNYAYYADVDLATYANGNGYSFVRCASDGTTIHNQTEWVSYSGGVKTYCVVTDWTNSGNWSTDDQKTWSIVGSTTGNAGWEGGNEDINIPLTFRFNGEGLNFYNTSVNLTKNSAFKVKNNTNNYYGYDCIETGEGSVISAGDVSGSGGSNITVVNSGSYEVYMKPAISKFWMQENSEASAIAFAETFLEKTDLVCKDSSKGQGDTNLSNLQGIWNAVENDGVDQLVELWGHLTTGAKNEFKTNSDDTIVAARERYIVIMGRYGSPTLTAFTGGPSYSNVITPLSTIVENNGNNIAIIIVVVSTISLVALGGFFFIKRKKESK